MPMVRWSSHGASWVTFWILCRAMNRADIYWYHAQIYMYGIV